MHVPSLTLEGVAFHLADGRCLFSELDLQLDATPTGLVGRNGAGKSVLAHILAGTLAPSRGRRLAQGRVHLLEQQVAVPPGGTIADLAGVAGQVAALARIEAGSVDPADFDALGERWDIHRALALALREQELPAWPADHPVAALSGGEAMRVALAGAWLAQADLLILDEPSNHLDRRQRQQLQARLRGWPGGLLLVSHDRILLDEVAQIVELSPQGLRRHGGGYSAYAEAAAQAAARGLTELERQRHAVRREERARHRAHERLQQRQARGRRDAREANQAPILLGLQKARSEASLGRLQQRQEAALAQQRDALAEAAACSPPAAEVVLHAPRPQARRRTVVLEQVRLPYGPLTADTLDLVLEPGQRLAVCGRNGSGKSSLLRLLAGRLAPLSGRCRVAPARAWLEQRLDGLEPGATPLALLRAADPGAGEAELRQRLVLLGLPVAALAQASGGLSGGERLKLALACALYAATPPELLLLDEPANHLDLVAQQALESMLRDYPGTLVVVSHDAALLQRLQLDARLDLDQLPLRLQPW